MFPPTTTSATTSLLTGKYPIETGWLGWTEKLPEYDVPCTRFLNTLTDENKTKIKTPTLELYPYMGESKCINKIHIYFLESLHLHLQK